MSHGYNRPIYRTITAGGAVYIPIDRYRENISISVTSGGSTFTADITLDNVIRSQSNSYDVHGSPVVAPASAVWDELIASAAANAVFNGERSGYAVRINVTAYVGDLAVRIVQPT